MLPSPAVSATNSIKQNLLLTHKVHKKQIYLLFNWSLWRPRQYNTFNGYISSWQSLNQDAWGVDKDLENPSELYSDVVLSFMSDTDVSVEREEFSMKVESNVAEEREEFSIDSVPVVTDTLKLGDWDLV